MEHYRCHHVYVNAKITERVGDALQFFPHCTTITFTSSVDRAALAAADLTEALLHPNPEAKFSKLRETQLESLRQLATLFQYCLRKPGAPPRAERTARQ